MGRLFSWQACPGCQLALQAEQNSRAHTAHWTSWGRAGESASFSWHTAWQVEEGHHVRHGSSSTSDYTEEVLGHGQSLSYWVSAAKIKYQLINCFSSGQFSGLHFSSELWRVLVTQRQSIYI